MIKLFNAFVKITGYLPYRVCFKTKVYYENKTVQSRQIKGKAIIVSNHTSVYDYAVMLFLFPFRTLRYQMAEILFKRKFLKTFLKKLGGILVDRDAFDFSFLKKSLDILKKNGVVGVFPESRLPKEGEERPLEFKTSVTHLSLESGANIIPVYTDGAYFKEAPAHVIIGTPIDTRALWNDNIDEKSNIYNITSLIREKIVELKDELERKIKETKKI